MVVSFIDSAFATKREYEQACLLPPSERDASFRAAANTERPKLVAMAAVSAPCSAQTSSNRAAQTVFKLVGLQALHKRAVTHGQPTRGERLQAHCEPILEAARMGQMSEATAHSLLSGDTIKNAESDEVRALSSKRKLPSILRFLFTSKVSWAVFTTEWLDSLARFLTSLGLPQGARVLEVCAGENTLSAPMRERGYDWVATDVTIRETAVTPPIQCGGYDAVRRYQPRAVFWSWWSEGATPVSADVTSQGTRDAQDTEESKNACDSAARGEDWQTADWCMKAEVPIIFVGEPRGGVTGSASFWAGPWRPSLVADITEEFHDVPRWDGQDDCSALIATYPPRPACCTLTGFPCTIDSP